jgi:glucose-1-phosphate adenylyltransferase
MGIYIFTWKKLRAYLISNEEDKEASKDFGKNIIPDMRAAGEKLVAYRFDGYWKDVGTIDSLWEANMDLLNDSNGLNLDDPSWKIYTEDASALAQYIGPDATVKNAYITQGCKIQGEVRNSVLFTGAQVKPGAKVIDTVLMPGAVVEAGAVVTRALVADGVRVGKNVVIGSAKSENIELVAKNVKGDE